MKKKKLRKGTSFKKTLDTLLSQVARYELLPEAIKRATEGEEINYQEAILLAQIIKATNGDTQSATFLRDSSGNKLKEGEVKEEIRKKFGDF